MLSTLPVNEQRGVYLNDNKLLFIIIYQILHQGKSVPYTHHFIPLNITIMLMRLSLHTFIITTQRTTSIIPDFYIE